MLNSPYAKEGAIGEGKAYMAAKANPYMPSTFFTKAAEKAWSDAIRGFSDDRTRRQKQALEGADIQYKNKVSDVEGRYATPINYIKDLLGINLEHSERVGRTGTRGLDLGMESSREAADIGSQMALGRGEAARSRNTFFADMLKKSIPKQTIEGYSNPRDYLIDEYLAKEAGLDADKMSVVKGLRQLKKGEDITLLDILNNLGVLGQQNA
jgi:hypothetical protein